MKEHLEKVKVATTRTLSRHVLKALDDARLQIEAQAMRFAGAKLPPIAEESGGIAERFSQNLYNYFEGLTTLKAESMEIEPENYDNLSLVDHDYLEAMIAMEGMVKQMRDREYREVKSLLTRFEAMFPNIRIGANNNPLDPEQIGDCFNEAIRPLGLKAHYLLTIYREFNKTVFGNYENVITEANEVLIEIGVLPELDITAEERERRRLKRTEARAQLEAELRAKEARNEQEQAARGQPRPTSAASGDPLLGDTRPRPSTQQDAGGNAEIFAMMQTLVQSLAERRGSDTRLPVNNAALDRSDGDGLAAQQDELRDQQHKLMSMLTDIQSRMLSAQHSESVRAAEVGRSINEKLEAGRERGELRGIDTQSGDVINLVTMLFEAIWKDRALPVVMKELIGRTQISIMKVALSDTDFFNNENHPARALLNELALAGIAWTETDDPDTDPAFAEVRHIVERLLAEPELGRPFLQDLVDELHELRARLTGTDARLERRVRESSADARDMDDINSYVKQKIKERILKGYLDPAIRNLLDTHVHNFLVKLVTREGPEGKSWKPVMSTIDVLLWTVQAEKQPGDRDRFNHINPRLVDNLSKALEIGGASKTKVTRFMRQLKQIQEYTFHKAEIEEAQPASLAGGARVLATTLRDAPTLPRNDPNLRKVDGVPLGTWFEFRSTTGGSIRCALVAKIDSIDKLFFADREGKKVAELTRMRLAAEMKAGSARIVSEGSLVNRAMQSVISDLKDESAIDGHGSAKASA